MRHLYGLNRTDYANSRLGVSLCSPPSSLIERSVFAKPSAAAICHSVDNAAISSRLRCCCVKTRRTRLGATPNRRRILGASHSYRRRQVRATDCGALFCPGNIWASVSRQDMRMGKANISYDYSLLSNVVE
ncbi:hypothetical protein LSAT2_030203 [Lamellibrachia satsuma]|nr:hypothetical protein LSAT2_030203 [Lamellibrachia satsuma]